MAMNAAHAMPPGAMDNKGPVVLGLTWTLRPLAFFIVLLRLSVRTRHRKTAGWDDLCISISAVRYRKLPC